MSVDIVRLAIAVDELHGLTHIAAADVGVVDAAALIDHHRSTRRRKHPVL